MEPGGEPIAAWGIPEFFLIRKGNGRLMTHGVAQRHALTWFRSFRVASSKAAAVRISPDVAGRILKQFRFKVPHNGVNVLARKAMTKLMEGKVPSGPTLSAKERKAQADEGTLERLRTKFKDAARIALGPQAKKDFGILPMDVALVAQEFALDAWVQYLRPRSR